MTWTSPVEIREQVRKLWDSGALPASLVRGESLFPKQLACKRPKSEELGTRFAEVQSWTDRLKTDAGLYRLVWKARQNTVVGRNALPSEIWIDSQNKALVLIDKTREAEKLRQLAALTREQQPGLLPWLERRPLKALELAKDWPLLLDMVAWLQAHPRPGLYMRQVDVPGVHSKWLERHRGVLAELLDLVLPESAVDARQTGINNFCRRYGFLERPTRVRFRVLDPAIRLLPGKEAQDLTLTSAAFAELNAPVSTVFVTENEINFLSFPEWPRALVLFGAGYGFDFLAPAAETWLGRVKVFYWGDIDTHGFAILNQFRAVVPQTQSFLMDEQTLLVHKALWGREDRQEQGELVRLNAEEGRLYDQLRGQFWGDHVRLEQERLAFSRIQAALRQL